MNTNKEFSSLGLKDNENNKELKDINSLPTFKKWNILNSFDQNPKYLPPEMLNNFIINGPIFNHLKYKDNTIISTSLITKVEGRIITTQSGTRYYLDGEPCTFLKDLLIKENIYDENNPLKFIDI